MSQGDVLSLPQVRIDLQQGQCGCKKSAQCIWFENQMREKLVGLYIAEEQPFEKQIVAAWLDVKNLVFEEYVTRAKKLHKGSGVRNAKKAERQGFVCKPFFHDLFIPDIVAINHSKKERCGRQMSEPYRRSVEEMGGSPTRYQEVRPPDCPVHYDYWWGVFASEPGYQQGEVTTDERLVAYIRLRRNGNYALYGQILGHGDYLKYGIMFFLHFSIVRWILARKDPCTVGLENLIYAGFYQGKEGLQLWKKKMLFEPAYLIL